MTMFYVYMWVNCLNGKSYIGKGQGQRAWNHLKPYNKSLLAKALRKNGRDAFQLVFLHVTKCEEEALSLEGLEIRSRNTLSPHGYNLTTGGEGCSRPCPPETAEKIRRANTGKKRNPEATAKQAEKIRGRKMSPEVREKVRLGCLRSHASGKRKPYRSCANG